jgi:DNA topoisomerase I
VLVLEFLEKHFSSLFHYDYTKMMEDNLDKIAANTRDITWTSVIDDYYREITDLLESLKNENPAKVEYAIDENHTYIIGKNGPVIKCSAADNVSFKPVKKEIDVHKLERGEYTLEDLVDESKREEFNLGEHSGHDILLKKGKFGIYALWGNENISLKRLGNRPMENITREEVATIIDETLNGTREINRNLSIRMSKRGPYIFFKTAGMKRPQFFSLKECSLDFMNCDVEELKQWIYDTHKVS